MQIRSSSGRVICRNCGHEIDRFTAAETVQIIENQTSDIEDPSYFAKKGEKQMRSRFSIFILVPAVIALGLFFAVHNSASQGKGSRSVEGSWLVRLTPTSNTPPFDEFMTFSAGGGIVESNNFPFHLLGLSAGPGHGTWSHSGDHSFQFTFMKFLFLPNGQASGTLKASGTISYSTINDTWSGPATVAICDNQGANCNTIDVTNGAATRIEVVE